MKKRAERVCPARRRRIRSRRRSSCGQSFEPLKFETLENRSLLSVGTWQTLAPVNPAAGPANTQAVMLLSDGTAMIQGGSNAATTSWYALTPDASGSYLTGSWSSLGSMNVGRLFFTTAMLPSGKVIAVGGEYSAPYDFTNAVEIYDPLAGAGGTWTSVTGVPTPPTSVGSNPPPSPQSQFGDDPIQVLPDGRVLAGYFNNGTTYLYDPANDTWTTTSVGKLRGDRSDEETWVKLPDDSILSYDIFASDSTGVFHAQRYIPALDQWVDASNLDSLNPPSTLGGPNEGFELGPAFLQPNGQVIFFGANGNTAIYTPSTDTWSAGPAEPMAASTQLVAADAPGAMMPNGNILMAFSPVGTLDAQNAYTFPSPSYIYEYDPTTQTFTDVTPAGLGGENAFKLNMLMLPSGQVLLANEAGSVQIYTPAGAPQDAWRPVITGVVDNGNNTFTLKGTQLNGISEGAAYGDDNEMSSNYPIIQFEDSGGNVFFARTYGWSSTGVATGSTPVTTQFTLPPGKTLSDFVSMTVIANGIPSAPASLLTLNNTNENIVLRVNPNDSTMIQALAGAIVIAAYPNNSASPIVVMGDGNDNSVTVDESYGVVNAPISFDGGGQSGAPGDRFLVVGGSGNDSLDLLSSGGGSASLTFDGSRTYSFQNIQQFSFDGQGGNDLLTVDSGGGLLNLPGGIQFDGGAGFNQLKLQQTGGDAQTSDTYSVGPNNGEGSDVITGPSGAQTVYFQNLAPVLDLVPALNAIVNGTPADNAINYAQGSVVANGLVTIDNQESYEFSNKDNLTINSRSGNDSINLNNPNVPTGATPGGLKSITVNGGDPTSPPGDALTVNAVPGVTDALFVQPTGQGAGIVQQNFTTHPNVTFSGVESLHLVGQTGDSDTFGVDGTAGDDSFVYNVGPAPDSGSITGLLNQNAGGSFPLTPISFSGMSPSTTRSFNTTTIGGTDRFTFAGTSGDDNLFIGNALGGAVGVQDFIGGVNSGSATLSNFASVTADGGTGNDAFTYDASGVAGGSPPTLTINGGGASGDSLTYKAASGALTTVDFAASKIAAPGAKDLFFSGLAAIVDQASGGAGLTIFGVANKTTTYTPTGVSSGIVQSAGNLATVNFTGVTGQLTFFGGGGTADEVVVNGTSGRDTINVQEASGVVSVTTNGTTYEPATLGTNVQILTVNGVGGQDSFQITPAAGIQFAPNNIDNLLLNVNGSATGANNAIIIQSAGGGTLAPNQFVVVNRDAAANSGTVRTFASAVQWPDINYTNIQVVSPNVAQPGGQPNLLIMGPDTNEPNEFQANAAFLGSASTIQVQHASIFANNSEFTTTPPDQDYYRVVAQQTGTLDFDVAFKLFNPSLLPAGGNLNLEVLDAAGNVMATASGGPATFGAEGAGGDARIRIPAIAGQSYVLHVFGANPNGTPNAAVVNGYDITIIDTPPPAPTMVELSRSVPPPIPGNPGTGDLPPTAAADDTGRSQFDNVTRINTPTIYVRLADGVFLNDLPGNGAPDTPFAGVIPIPFSPNATTPGFRVAMFLGNNTQTPVGFATPVAGFPGLYQYTFTTPLADGVNHLTAEVQMLDPSAAVESGFGNASASLDITVDTAPPAALFGSPAVPNSGLDAPSDTGVPSQSATLADRITRGSAPTFYGLAEANAIVRLFVDANQNGVLDAGDVLIGHTTATPIDGANQLPGGQWRLASNIDLNNPSLGLPLDGLRNIFVTGEDLAGNVSAPQKLTILLDTQGPTVNNVTVTGSPAYDLFAVKPNVVAPTPLVNSLDITFHDQPVRVGPDFVYPAVNQILATTVGNYSLVGDATGAVTITSVTFADSTVSGIPGTTVVTLHFAKPLADDRFTLVISDHITDNAGNALDGDFGGAFPSGDAKPAGSFSGRFTVDSRPEFGVYSAGSAAIDLNGNFLFDPQNVDATNRDTVFTIGYPSDRLFAGKFPDSHGVVNGFDKLGAYGFINGHWRWLLDLNGDGAIETSQGDVNAIEPLSIDGLPIAGNFDGNPAHGAQTGLFDGRTWWFDMNGDHVIDATDIALGGELTGNMRGLPMAGDFDGDGKTDLATFANGTFYFDLAALDPGGHLTGNTNKTINVQQLIPNSIGFADVQLRPIAADMDQDGITDIGLYAPGRTQSPPSGVAEWYVLISNDPTGSKRAPGSVATLDHAFDPIPLGHDLFAKFGDQFGLPIVGNFDPPANGQQVVGGWLNNLYHDVLGRAPSYDEWHAWSQAVDNGAVTPKQVAQLFLASPERRGGIIDNLYQQYLGRSADAAGLNYWLSVWQANGGPEQVQAGIIGSLEYYHTAGQQHPNLSADEAWVTALYQNILNRQVDAAGLAYWVDYIQTHSKQSVVIGFVTSNEYRLGLIQGWFTNYLGRTLDDSGAQYWLQQMQLGATQESIQTGILSSDEYRNKP